MVLIAKNQTAGKYVPNIINISQHHPCHDMQGHRVRWIMPGQHPRIPVGPQSNEAKTQCRHLTDSKNHVQRFWIIARPCKTKQCWYLCLSTPSTTKSIHLSQRHGKALAALPLTLVCAWAQPAVTPRRVQPGKTMDERFPPAKKTDSGPILGIQDCGGDAWLPKNAWRPKFENCNMFGAILRPASRRQGKNQVNCLCAWGCRYIQTYKCHCTACVTV